MSHSSIKIKSLTWLGAILLALAIAASASAQVTSTASNAG